MILSNVTKHSPLSPVICPQKNISPEGGENRGKKDLTFVTLSLSFLLFLIPR